MQYLCIFNNIELKVANQKQYCHIRNRLSRSIKRAASNGTGTIYRLSGIATDVPSDGAVDLENLNLQIVLIIGVLGGARTFAELQGVGDPDSPNNSEGGHKHIRVLSLLKRRQQHSPFPL